MTERWHSLVLAIDGGGTRCRVAASIHGVVTEVETGAANVSTDFDGAVAQVVEGLAALGARLGRPAGDLQDAPAFVGIAGVTGPDMADRLGQALPLRTARIRDDRPAAVRAALGRGDGALAHCGTGSFFAAQADGEIRLSGGWGPVLGDEASAQWVGRRALAWTLEAEDGRQARSPLSDRLLARFGGAAGIVRFAATASPSDFATLARDVTAAAESDPMARTILGQGAAEITRALRGLGVRPGQRLALGGGIGPHYEPFLGDDLRAGIVPAGAEPLSGALSLAQDFAEELAHARG